MGTVPAGIALAPHSVAFVSFHCPPAWGQCSGRNEEVTAGFGFERLPGGPYRVPEGRVLQKIAVAFLPNQRGIVADFPMDGGGDDKSAVLSAKRHLVIE